ncbi:unnamed protein product [Musa textilis]
MQPNPKQGRFLTPQPKVIQVNQSKFTYIELTSSRPDFNCLKFKLLFV